MQQQMQYWSGLLPLDKDGFTKSFDIENFDGEEVRRFYSEYGIVIFDNILTKVEVENSIKALWDEVESSSYQRIDRNDMSTWDNFYCQPNLNNYGFVGIKVIDQPQFWANRANLKAYKAFKSLFQLSSGEKFSEPLLALFDRGSILRPSKLHPDWKIKPIPHFDINPWWWTKVQKVIETTWRRHNQYGMRYQNWLGEGCYVPKVRNFTKLQGVLAFSDTNSESGSFEAVCGFHNHIDTWCRNTPSDTRLHQCPDLMDHMQKVYQRAGSLLIFSRELPHGISPNVSEKQVRYAQYLRMSPQSSLMLTEAEKKERIKQVRNMLPKKLLSSQNPIHKEIFMLSEQLQNNQ